MSDGGIEKVQIFAYTNKELNKLSETVKQPFYLPVNPEKYSKQFKIQTDKRQGHGNQGTDPRYTATVPEELKLDFVFDGTDTIENYRYTDKSGKSVKAQLDLFLKTVYKMNGNIHRPNFLKVHWGTYLVFPCILSALDIDYQLFEPSGDPLRIKISATFLNYLAQEERAAREDKSSPDLTHLRVSKAGDRFDLMVNQIYNTTATMLQICRANDLTGYRPLPTGVQLRFPPIEKGEPA